MYSNLEETEQTSRKWGSVWKIGVAVIGLVLIGTVATLHQDKLGRNAGAVIVKRQDKMMTAEKQLHPNSVEMINVNEDSNPSAVLSNLGSYTNMKNLIETRGCPNIIFKPTTGNNPYPGILPSLGCEITPSQVTLFGLALHPGVWSLSYRVSVTTSGSLSCCKWRQEPVGPRGSGDCYDPNGCQMSKVFMAVNENLPMIARPLNFVQFRSLVTSGNMCPQQLIMKSADGKKYVMTNPGNCGLHLNRPMMFFWTKFNTGDYGMVQLLASSGNSFNMFQVQAFGADGKRGAEKNVGPGGSIDVSAYFPTVPAPFVVTATTSSFDLVY